MKASCVHMLIQKLFYYDYFFPFWSGNSLNHILKIKDKNKVQRKEEISDLNMLFWFDYGIDMMDGPYNQD